MAFSSVLLEFLSNLFAAIYFHVDEKRLKERHKNVLLCAVLNEFVWRG